MIRHAVVIGAGVGGLAASARLLQTGARVTLLESLSRAGGKCGSLRHRGVTVDVAPHVFSCSHAGELGKVARLLGENLEFIIKNPAGRVILGSRSFPLPARFADIPGLARLGLSLGVSPRKLLGVLQHFATLCFPLDDVSSRLPPTLRRSISPMEGSSRGYQAPFDQSLRDWTLRYTDDRNYHLFLSLCSILAFVFPYDQASAGEFQCCIQRMVQGPGIGYPRGGCQGLMDTLVRGLTRHGVSIRLKERVERILVENHRVTGVFTRKGLINADAVFFNGGVNALPALLEESTRSLLQAPYQRPSLGTVSIAYLLKEPVFSEPLILGYPDGDPADICTRIHQERFSDLCQDGFYIVVPTNFDGALAPKGQQIVLAGTLFPADLSKAGGEQETVEALEQGLRRRFPHLFETILHRSVHGPRFVSSVSGRSGSGDAVGAAQSVDQCGKARALHCSGIEGLYIVGADTGRGAIGTELAAQSGLMLPLQT